MKFSPILLLFTSTLCSNIFFTTADHDAVVTKDDLANLYNKLSTFAMPKYVDPDDWIRECAYYIMKPDYDDKGAGIFVNLPSEGSVDDGWVLPDYFYVNQPSGACSMKLESAFGMSWNYTLKSVFEEYFDGIKSGSEELATLNFSEIKDSLPQMTLPSLMVEPQTAKDVVDVVKFADEFKLQLSVKNTGHNYAGQSDVADSFQLNMRKFPKYSENNVIACTDNDGTSVSEPLEGPPCKLALARKKEAIVRVSGSEGNDSIYNSVRNWNHKMPREKRFQVSGGGEGAVGAGGGYLMGGGLGNGPNDRKWGICIDQVLELEMVLANGQHVKFGPSEWDEIDGYLYPQTTKVKGLCNKNVHHLESEWEWDECDEDIPFRELWQAVRGGGGGTWGVLISSWMQLHDDEEWFLLSYNADATQMIKSNCEKTKNCDTVEQAVKKVWIDFLIDFMNGPISKEIGNDESDSCGMNNGNGGIYQGLLFNEGPSLNLRCIGKSAAEKFVDGWRKYVINSTHLLNDIDFRLLQDVVNMSGMGGSWGDMMLRVPAIGTLKALVANVTFSLDEGVDSPEKPNLFMKSPLGHDLSVKTAAPYSSYGYNLLIPTQMLLEKSDLIYELLPICGEHEWGRNTAISSDGMDSMNESFRKAFLGCQLHMDNLGQLNFTTYEELDDYYSKVQAKIMEYNVDDDDQAKIMFPGIQELNHVQGNTPLPLKDDWTKVCPYNLTTEERKEKCMSAQETVWGTEQMVKLEKLKRLIDPNNMFQVYHGIGQRDVSPQQVYKWPTQLPNNFTVEQTVAYTKSTEKSSTTSHLRGHLRGRN